MNKQLQRVKRKINRIVAFIKDRFVYWCFNYESNRCDRKRMICKIILRGRQLVGFYGECHMNVYTNLLCHSHEFKARYFAINAHEIEYLGKWHSKQVRNKHAWDKLDILIYNPGMPERAEVPTLMEILDWVTNDTEKIEVTNAAFKGYMPQHTEKVSRKGRKFIWGDKNINKALGDNKTVLDVIEDLSRDDFYTGEYVKEYFEKSIIRMSKYEGKCTIKIADYINNNGRDRVLYHSVTHPNLEIMIELTDRIAERLGIKIDSNLVTGNSVFNNFDLTVHGEVVYPSIYKGLGIRENWKEREVYPGDHRDKSYKFAQYIEAYMNNARE